MSNSLWIFILSFLVFSCGQGNEPDKTDHSSHAAHNSNPGGGAAYVRKMNKGEIIKDTMKGSPKMLVMTNIGTAHIHISYNSPGVKDRVIWGGLVPYDRIWVSGAHSATSVNINEDFIVNGKTVPAGTYAFFTIPGKDKWIVILNKNYTQHLTDDYDPSLDVVRTELIPQAVPFTPRLIYQISDAGNNKGSISMQWEKIRIDLPVTFTNSTP